MSHISREALRAAADEWRARRMEEVEAEYQSMFTVAEKLGGDEPKVTARGNERNVGITNRIRAAVREFTDSFTCRDVCEKLGLASDERRRQNVSASILMLARRGELEFAYKGTSARDPHVYRAKKASPNGQHAEQLAAATV